MKFTAAAVLAIATGAAAWGNETVVTETVDVYTTFCPGPTEIPIGPGKTHTVTKSGLVTITDCPCTITRPVTTTSSVYCPPTEVPAPPPGNATVPAPPPPATYPPPPAGTPTAPPAVPTGGAAALSGAGLAGLVGLAAFVL